jgi:N-acetylated-alpha-linked acidic dipeptidase
MIDPTLATSSGVAPRAHGEEALLGSIDGELAWELVEVFSGLVRETGTEDERRAADEITRRLAEWGVPHAVHEPELLISLPRVSRLIVGGREYQAKTPSMAGSTGDEGVTAQLVYLPIPVADTIEELFAGASGVDFDAIDADGKIVIVEGLQFPGVIPDLEKRGALAVVCISPGEAIHESILTTIWGSPDLTSWSRKPTMPVLNVSAETGRSVLQQLTSSTTATVVTTHEEGWVKAPLIVAEIAGSIEPERFVLLHGHLDSWHVGIGDNATGDAALLELARVFWLHRELLPRTLRIAWWPGHSQGRYAGSTWYADAFALDIEDNCICHINCDSPGCRDADAFDEVEWMAELGALATAAVRDVAGSKAAGIDPPRAGDLSFSNIGVSTAFMASSVIQDALRREKGLYAVGGAGANIEWHTERDTIEVGDRARLLRDTRVYASAVLRAVALPVHPLDFRATVDQLAALLGSYQSRLAEWIDLAPSQALLHPLREGLEALYTAAGDLNDVARAATVNQALRTLSRTLVPILYAREARYRQDPAVGVPLLPDFAHAESALGAVPDGVIRTELTRARNRLDRALIDATRISAAAVDARA